MEFKKGSESVEILPDNIGEIPAIEAVPLLERAALRTETLGWGREFGEGLRQNLRGAKAWVEAQRAEVTKKTLSVIVSASFIAASLSACAKGPNTLYIPSETAPRVTEVSPTVTEVMPNIPTITPTETATLEPTLEWQIPSTETWASWLADPSFLKQFLVNQFDLNQYANLDPKFKQEFAKADYPGNSCGEAVITELINMYTYRETGKSLGITTADVINELLGKTYLIRPNGTNMTDYNLKSAIDFYGQKTDLFSTVSLTTYCGDKGCTSAIPGSEWSGLFKTAKKDVFDQGGVLVAFVQKGGNPPGSEGHFIIISSFSNGQSLIVDTLDGSARVMALGAYVSTQPGLLSLIGVVPTS
jgi:hypothetical protein